MTQTQSEPLFTRVTIRTVNPAGWPIDFELREGQHPRQAIEWLSSHGYQPAPTAADAAPAPAVQAMPAITSVPIAPAPVAAAGKVNGAPPAVDPTPAPAATGEIAFLAETLAATVDKGKAYWKIMGGQYQTYGVTVWPEVLQAAGFDPDALNPLQTYDLTGWTAVCSVKANGQPRKVTALAR